MSVVESFSNKNQATFNTDTSKIFLFGCKYQSILFKNTTGADLTLVGGEVIGRDSTTLKGAILASAATDGSQFPLGINSTKSGVLADDDEIMIDICVYGEVAEDKIILDGSDTLNTLVSLRPIRDRILSDTMGVKLISSTELTAFDN